MPRFKPYTAIGIKRVPCVKCGKPSFASWNICADKIGTRTQYRGLCVEHDIELNEMVMRWVWGDARGSDVLAYRARLTPFSVVRKRMTEIADRYDDFAEEQGYQS